MVLALISLHCVFKSTSAVFTIVIYLINKAEWQGGATHVDIACDPDLVKLAMSLTSLPVKL